MNTNDDFLEFLYDYIVGTLDKTEKKLKNLQEVIKKTQKSRLIYLVHLYKEFLDIINIRTAHIKLLTES